MTLTGTVWCVCVCVETLVIFRVITALRLYCVYHRAQ